MAIKLQDKGVIFSPDLITIQECLKILRECGQFFSALKIGNVTLYKYGIGVINQIKDHFDIPIICDFKLMDIPDMAEEIIGLGADNGIDGAMIWGLTGYDTVRRCVNSYPDIMIFVLTEYTHSEVINEETSNKVAEEAVTLRAYGIQAPATRLTRIKKLRQIVGKRLKIISCGVGYQGTPYGVAIKHGANFEIIGRSIYQAQNPAQEAEKAFTSISSSSQRD